ncbi:hypothetical protein E2562_006238 [Oryza meyeriana var. granulata]|uniref:Uncharacterized protein n=1 Tax=Oryza meyeriana var. granulata TaxID=110450 RepID=A0A6G1CQ42_9ORYZ|nr:hypothetical protein E2562_006238 [Oryza meyeriana var. granulata]
MHRPPHPSPDPVGTTSEVPYIASPRSEAARFGRHHLGDLDGAGDSDYDDGNELQRGTPMETAMSFEGWLEQLRGRTTASFNAAMCSSPSVVDGGSTSGYGEHHDGGVRE